MISSPDLRIDAAENSFACYGHSSNEVPRPILIYVAAKGDGFAYCDCSRLRCSATDSNFRCCKGEKFRLQWSWRRRGPRPIPFFAAAKENGSACRTPLPHGCSDSGFQGSNLAIAAEIARDWPSCVQRFLISGVKLGNRCKDCPRLDLLRAVILDFRW